MFPLFDHTRRQICMAVFVGFCALPTLAIAGLCISRHLSWHKQAEEQRLSQELGLDVSVDSVKHTLPGVVRYQGLKLTDPETGQELFRCAELVATWTTMTPQNGQTRPAIVLDATRAESPSGAWKRLYDALRLRLECQIGRPEIEIRVTADQWVVHDGNQSKALELAVLEGSGLQLLPGGVEAQLAVRLPDVPASQPLRMRIVRNRQISPPEYEFALDCRACPIPCRLLATWFKDLSSLSPSCSFAGYLLTNSTPGGWSGELEGQLAGVDLGRLTRNCGLPMITGTANITNISARFQSGRIEKLNGCIDTGPGRLGPDMLAALVRRLRMSSAPQVSAAGESAFERLCLEFRIDSHGVSVEGRCGDMNLPGAVAVAGGRSILSQPLLQPQPVAALIQALAPANEFAVPATRQTGWLASLLPVPDGTKTR
jgi:hypothetical protein